MNSEVKNPKARKTIKIIIVIIASVVAVVSLFDLFFTAIIICSPGSGGIIVRIVLSVLWIAVIFPMMFLILLNTVFNHFVCRVFGRAWEIMSLSVVVYNALAFSLLLSGLLGRTSNEYLWTDLLFGVSAVLPNILTVFEVMTLETRIKKNRE